MENLIVKPKNKAEFQLLEILFKKMKIKSAVLSDEDVEDYGLIKLMKEADITKTVSKESVLKKLNHE